MIQFPALLLEINFHTQSESKTLKIKQAEIMGQQG